MTTTHTMEPWHWEREPNGQYTVNVGGINGRGMHVAYIAPQGTGAAMLEAANARRIVACINTLDGITTDELERGNKMFRNLIEECYALRQDKLDLLAALKTFTDANDA
ncbi:MAG: hypothetical protein ACTS6J_12055 [Burkholderiales bacterium]